MIDQAEKLRDMFAVKNEIPVPQVTSSRVITVTSGKGGVGKTNFAVNLAIELSRHNKRVIIIDADIGLANIEVLFGIIPKYSFADMINGSRTIYEVLTDGPMGIKFISGGSGLKELANITDKQLSRIFDNLSYLDSISDIIIMDTGAGISNSVINFIKASTEAIIVTTPEPTSVADAYALIKTTLNTREQMPSFKIVVNRTESNDEGLDIFNRLNSVTEKFLYMKLDLLGFVPVDPMLVKAVKRQQPAAICYPNSAFAEAIKSIAEKLLDIKSEVKPNNAGLKSFMKKFVNIFSK